MSRLLRMGLAATGLVALNLLQIAPAQAAPGDKRVRFTYVSTTVADAEQWGTIDVSVVLEEEQSGGEWLPVNGDVTVSSTMGDSYWDIATMSNTITIPTYGTTVDLALRSNSVGFADITAASLGAASALPLQVEFKDPGNLNQCSVLNPPLATRPGQVRLEEHSPCSFNGKYKYVSGLSQRAVRWAVFPFGGSITSDDIIKSANQGTWSFTLNLAANTEHVISAYLVHRDDPAEEFVSVPATIYQEYGRGFKTKP